MELDKSNILINSCIGCEQIQLLVEGDIIVPDSKPDMDMVLSCEAGACIDNYEAMKGRVNLKGAVKMDILYLSLNDEKSVHSMEGEGQINDFVNLDGAEENSIICVECMLTDFECKKINERKVGYRAVIMLNVCAYVPLQISAVRNIEDISQQQQMKRKLVATDIVCCDKNKVTVKEEIKIDGTRPNIQEILSLGMNIINKECHCSDETVNVTGDLKFVMLYKGEDENKPLEAFESEAPLKLTLDAKNTRDHMDCNVKICIKDVFYNILPDEDGENRIVDIEAVLCTYVMVTNNSEYELLEDAYCLNHITQMKNADLVFEREICRNKSQCPVKEVIFLAENAPDMLQIMTTKGRAWIDNIEVKQDKVILEGVIETCILYVTQKDELPVYCYKDNIAFKHIAEAKNAMEGMNTQIDINVEHIGVNMISDREVEVRCMLNINLIVKENIKDSCIADIDFMPLTKEAMNSMASIVVYTVKKGDTLWKLAKSFNTTVEEIVEINNIENPDLIYPGERFVIVKRV